ncbi:D-beta-D-heptose 1-phosphate adenosyltransferase, partial [Streptomyces sp. SID486]|uniref:PfkB family carbohydrate kinase n=1 Tax=Streptomyces sp. SID486 TaxID=2690264 RepID=UPI0013BBB183
MTDSRTPLVVVGDALLDHDLCGRAERLAPDAPVPVVHGTRRSSRPGGAALAACLAAADGRPVTLVTALGPDAASDTLRELLAGRVTLVEVPLEGTLSSKTRVMAGDRPLLRLDDGEGRAREATPQAVSAIAAAAGVLVADYGRGTADVLRDALAHTEAPVVWDPHVRGRPPVPGVRLATPSAQEARAFARQLDDRDSGETPGLRTAARDARALVGAWRARAVAVTLGDRGALLSHGETPLLVPT